MRELEGKNAVVTGANRGLRKAIAAQLAENGCGGWACARKADEGFEKFLKKLSQKHSVQFEPVYFDLCDRDDIKRGFRNITSCKKNIDILINNAGIGHLGLFQMTKMEHIGKIYAVNLFAPMYLS